VQKLLHSPGAMVNFCEPSCEQRAAAGRRATRGKKAETEQRAEKQNKNVPPSSAHPRRRVGLRATNRHADQLNRLLGDQARAVRRPVFVTCVALRRHCRRAGFAAPEKGKWVKERRDGQKTGGGFIY
jgi:hypothetical protein